MKSAFRKKANKGFTLVEMVTVVAIIGVSLFTFYTVFLLNWSSLNNFITRADLLQEMDKMVDDISVEGRNSKRMDVIDAPTQKTLAIFNGAGAESARYTMNNKDEFIVTKQDPVFTETVSRNIDFTRSKFEKKNGGRSVYLTLVMKDDNFGRDIVIQTSTEIYPRTP